MSESVSDFPYVIGLHDVEDAGLMHTIGAEQRDMEILGVKEELEEAETDPENNSHAEVVYGPRYEEFEHALREHEDELSDHLAEFDYEEVIDEKVEESPTTLKRFYPEELRNRIDQRKASLPSVRYNDPETVQNERDVINEAASEEISKYAEETEGNIVDYNEIKRNTAVVFGKQFSDLIMAEKSAIISELED